MFADPRRKRNYKGLNGHHYRSLEDFVSFLASSPRIPSYVQELRLVMRMDCLEEIDPALSTKMEHDVAVLAKVIRHLPRLRILRFGNLGFCPTSESLPVAQLDGFPRSLERMDILVDPWLDSPTSVMDGFLGFASLFSHMGTLHLEGTLSLPSGTSPPKPPSNLRFDALELIGCSGVDVFIDAFQPMLASTPQPVKTLELECSAEHRLNADALKRLWDIT
ncbi:hypothetical protein NM688_g8949 [Phlebia brevispora]|uniref:Uncharacterized protein n=1 Tax=Phlebia brevispora TaxID=194682 RepID=A0ACC1RLU1_9APHY|nr:hypothetical protein NM688_g8949 [Phlebia brevispora]